MKNANEFMPWKEEYNLGIELIDDQHKKLVSIINDLYSAFYRKDSNTMLFKILCEMETYSHQHFATEENYFKITMYKNQSEHILSHNEFRHKAKDFKQQFQSGQPITFRLINYLKEWLLKHILKEDKEYVPTLKQTLNLQ